jgi:hypothetical protein
MIALYLQNVVAFLARIVGQEPLVVQKRCPWLLCICIELLFPCWLGLHVANSVTSPLRHRTASRDRINHRMFLGNLSQRNAGSSLCDARNVHISQTHSLALVPQRSLDEEVDGEAIICAAVPLEQC